MHNLPAPKSMSEILEETFRIYGRNFPVLLGIAAIAGVPLIILCYVCAVTFVLPAGMGYMPDWYWPFTIAGFIVFIPSAIIVGPLMAGALIFAAAEQYRGQPVNIGNAYRFAWRRIGRLVGAGLLAGLAIGALWGTGIGIPAAIYLAVRWAFIWQAVLLEDCSITGAFSRSASLIKQNWWRVLGLMLVAGIIVATVTALLWLTVIGTVLAMPLIMIFTTLVYYDLRVRKENYVPELPVKETGGGKAV